VKTMDNLARKIENYTLMHLFAAAGVRDDLPFARDIVINPEMEPKPHQISGLNQALTQPSDRFGLFDETGCVSADTEFLTPTGWKRIDEYEEGDKVGQFDPDSRLVTFCEPERYVKEPCSTMIHIHPSRGTDQMVSDDHRVLLYSKTNYSRDGRIGKWSVKTGSQMYADRNKRSGHGFCTTFKVDRPGVGMSDSELRLMVAVIADGHFSNSTNRVAVRLKKERKKLRLERLLKFAGVAFKRRKCGGKVPGYDVFTFCAPRRDKVFDAFYWGCSDTQLAMIVDEAKYWDGSVDRRNPERFTFASTVKESADFIQYAAAATGRTASVKLHDYEGQFCSCYKVMVRESACYASGRPGSVKKVRNKEGYKYCFTVPTGFLIMRRNGFIFATGNCMKTLPSQAFCLYHAGIGNKVVVVMPPVLLDQFDESLRETFIGVERQFTWHILTEGPKKRDMLFEQWDATRWPDMLLMTYQTFSKVPRAGRKKNKEYDPNDPTSHEWLKTEPREQDFIAKELRDRGYEVAVCDEAQALKNYSSTTSKCLQHFLGVNGEKALLLMTGTPAHNTLLDTFGLIKLVTPDKYASKRSFERLHCVYTTNSEGWSQLIGFQNKDVLHRALYAQARRVTKDQVLNLKEPHVVDRTIHLAPEHHRLYQKLVRERMLEVGEGMITALTQQKLRESCLQIVTTPERFTDQKLRNAVFEEVEELLDEIGPANEKVVLFATHQETVRSLANHFAYLKPVTVYGGNGGGKQNRANIEIFKTDPDCRLAVMHPLSGGVGLNLQDVCRYMIFVEPFSVPGQFKQASDRIHRGEIKHVVTFYILKVRGTLGPKMIRDMLNKEKDIMYVTKDAKSVLADLLDEAA